MKHLGRLCSETFKQGVRRMTGKSAEASPALLSPEERSSPAMASLLEAGWSVDEQRDVLSKDFRLGNFNRAWGFMSRVALEAERTDHHPDWANSFGRVSVSLTTHSSDGLTLKDLRLAAFCEKVAKELYPPKPKT